METIYYTDGVVWVTNQRLVFVDTTYWLIDIDRVEVVTSDTRRPFWLMLAMALFMLPLFLLLEVVILILNASNTCITLGIILIFLLLGFHASRSIYHLLSQPHDMVYILRLKTRSARVDAYSSLDPEYLELVRSSVQFILERYKPDKSLFPTSRG